MVENAEPGAHPAVDITLHTNHYFGFLEASVDWRVSTCLAVIPLAVFARERVYVVRYWIRISYVQNLLGLDTKHTRMEFAAALIDCNRSRWRLKVLTFESGFDI